MLSTKEVFLIASLLCFVTFLVLFSFRENSVKGIRNMLLASVLGMAGNMLYAFGRELPPFLAYELANTVYASASAAVYVGYRRLFSRRPHVRPLAFVVAGLMVLIAVFHYAHDSFFMRTLAVSSFQVGIAAGIGLTVLQARSEWRKPYYPKLFILGMSLSVVLGHSLRVIWQFLSPVAPASLLEPSGANVFILAAGAFALPVLAFGGLLIAHRRIVVLAENAANQDYLTGSWSRRAFFEMGERELARARRTKRPMSVLLFDLDHFKQVNDINGHDAGDQLLIDLVKNATQELREIDSLCRLGGDEFAVLMPETDLLGALVVARRIKEGTERNCTERAGVTLSIGAATLRPEDTLNSLVKRADIALYQAKGKGRNQIMMEDEFPLRQAGTA
jgi:diguanylate cyclase (GGDEF)-like protein